eukprot:jgi/Botrbrau1/22168/Bobra.0501s0001.1
MDKHKAVQKLFVPQKLKLRGCGSLQDDGNRCWARDLVEDVACQLAAVHQAVRVCYNARYKAPGVPHHSKAGNINNALLKSPHAHAEFLLVLDCDMIVKAEFLKETLPYFFERDACGCWDVKHKACLVQVPQRFYNLGRQDPWWHSSEDFNAIGFHGHDGLGAVPCVGTGCLFRRACLVAMGGQSLHSVTEDYKTGFNTLSDGFSTMYCHKYLCTAWPSTTATASTGNAPAGPPALLQILTSDNPLTKPGLNFAQVFKTFLSLSLSSILFYLTFLCRSTASLTS